MASSRERTCRHPVRRSEAAAWSVIAEREAQAALGSPGPVEGVARLWAAAEAQLLPVRVRSFAEILSASERSADLEKVERAIHRGRGYRHEAEQYRKEKYFCSHRYPCSFNWS